MVDRRESAKILACRGAARDDVDVTDNDREKTLSRFSSELNRSTPARSARAGDVELGRQEIEFLAEGLAFGPRALHAAASKVTQRYNLGPRGAWILNVISHGVAYPLELASVFCVGRSLITAELARLIEAGLVDSRPGQDDRRKTELTLTPLGKQASAEIRDDLLAIVRRRLAGFDGQEVRLVAEVLRALSKEPE
jgi:DNA-binding MarR family transcriptional regulator